MSETEGKKGGLIGSLRRLAEGFVALVQTRVELFASELQSEKLRFLDLLLRLAAVLALAMIGIGLGTLTLALIAWHLAQFAGLVAVTVVFLGSAALMLWRLRASLRKEPMPFAKTLEEFKKDRTCFSDKD